MVHVFEMRQFVQDDVIAHEFRSLDEAPVQGNGAVPGTGTPARALVAHHDAAHLIMMQRSQLANAGGQFTGSQAPEVPLHGWSQIIGWVLKLDLLSGKTNPHFAVFAIL